MGSPAPLNDALRWIANGQSVDIGGPQGSGRTRIIDDLDSRLADRGAAVARTRPSNEPFGSLEPIIGTIGLEHEDLASATQDAHARLLSHLRAGVVVLADDAERLDGWTADLLDKSRADGIIVRTRLGEADIVLPPVTAGDLQPLFAGPEVLHYLQSDGAQLLHQRAGSSPARILDLVGCWIRAGVASWQDGQLAVGREALDRLRTGLRVDPLAMAGSERTVGDGLADTWRAVSLLHPWATTSRIAQVTQQPGWALEGHLTALGEAGVVEERDGLWLALARPPFERWSRASWTLARSAAADALPDDADERLLRLIESDQVARIPDAARAISAKHVAEGRPGVARAVLAEALAFARREKLDDHIQPLLQDSVCVALSPQGPRLLDLTRLEISRSDPQDAAGLTTLCDLARQAMTGGGDAVRHALDSLPAFENPELELWRHRLAAFAGASGDLDEYQRWVDRATQAVAHLPGGPLNAKAWVARVRYRQRRYLEAGQLNEEVYDGTSEPVTANAHGLNAAIAWLEAEDFANLDQVITKLQASIPQRRTPVHSAMLATLHRTSQYRRGSLPKRDKAYEEALLALDVPTRTAPAFVTEAAICWRRGELDDARQLAERSAAAWQDCKRPWLWALMRSLAARCDAAHEPRDLEAILAAADASPSEEIAIQTRALLCVDVDLPAERLMGDQPKRYPARARREVLSLYEARSLLRQNQENSK